jgi:hypothetical protein
VLPAANTPFARAADAVRAGFFAAHAADGAPAVIQVIEIDDKPAAFDAALASARGRGARLLVGPLTRALVNTLGARREVPLPVLTLTLPDAGVLLPADVLGFGVAVEHDARASAQAALAESGRLRAGALDGAERPRFLIVAGKSALARRVAETFRDVLTAHGERAEWLVPASFDQTVAAALAATAEQRYEAALLALDAREASVVRAYLPRELPVYATSLVNPGGAASAAVAADLEGLRFVDMPWLLELDHPAVMIYPRPDPPLAGELQRLYALGIDAYRVASTWLQSGLTNSARFVLDGVTGHLVVTRDRDMRVERTPTLAVFRAGAIAIEGTR